jgi:ketosteroid isomerase-like protein
MKSIIAGAILLVASAPPAVGQERTDPVLNRLAAAFAAAFNERDAGKIAAFYTDDAVVMPPDMPMVKGREAIETYYRRGFAQSSGTVRLAPFESEITGMTAFETGTSSMTIGNQAETGKYVIVYRRVKGEWKIAYDIFNNDAARTR